MLIKIWCKFRCIIRAVCKNYTPDNLIRYSPGDPLKGRDKEAVLIYMEV